MRFALTAAALLLLAACQRAVPPEDAAGARRIEADVRALADDRMQGRATGSAGFDLAAGYVIERMRAIGLQPAGDDGGYRQRVPLLQAQRLAEGNALVIERDGAATALRFRDQFLPLLNFEAERAQVSAPAVFVAQAVHAPELGQDDFAGLELRGKIAVLFGGAPARFPADQRAYYASTDEKLRALAERGAVGAVFVATTGDEETYPWARSAAQWQSPGLSLRGADGGPLERRAPLRVVARVSAAAADLLLGGDGRSAAQLYRDTDAGRLRGFALPGKLSLAAHQRIVPLQSHNLVARLPGGARADEHVVFSAHLDHIGVGAAVGGDAVYNGAVDNALGVAVMLEAARALATAPTRPRRSLLFVAVTGEEHGLLGAQWFARHPGVAPGTLVANLNLDMPLLLAPTRDAVAVGIEHSSLGPLTRQAAREVGMTLSPDPAPQEVMFVRSDQYAFIRAGVPAVYLNAGVVGAGFGDDPRAAQRDYLRRHYHQPSDDARLPIQYADAARLARLNARLATLIADAPQRPTWNTGDFFGQRYGAARPVAPPEPAHDR
ncbi:M20/M25/M40 family metallo-hydrolase [Lysobacter sp. 5GHs7-4]|uniref:M20/M25/M40 family metallo-hydrolase n=1 Tax=Lysobacter sp. 5GHs7-4 TaxID=2904253 RepID=UPI001E540839|nr:M20/M25/M40 family metallo-hydrolase [Lysobacter sp. 5GHs7-4]UHQ23458.1 M20/M25/M40 family metallo-hydrolase [Lysobacter sp. 5GHs7-4]